MPALPADGPGVFLPGAMHGLSYNTTLDRSMSRGASCDKHCTMVTLAIALPILFVASFALIFYLLIGRAWLAKHRARREETKIRQDMQHQMDRVMGANDTKNIEEWESIATVVSESRPATRAEEHTATESKVTR